MKKTNYERRSYFINAGIQLRYMSVIVVSMLVASFVTGFVLYFGIWGAVIPEFSTESLANKLETASRLRDYEQVRMRMPENKELSVFKEAKLLSDHEQGVVAGILASANLKLIPRLLAVILVMAVASIFISHKIAGPAYRFNRSAVSIAEGDLTTKFNLRKDDEFKDVAESLEKMAGSLRKRIGDVLSSANEISRGLDKLQGTAEDKRLISELKAGLTALEKELSAFKLKA